MEKVTVTIHPRKLARSMARAQLDKAKVAGYNKQRLDLYGRKTPSVFSVNWQKLAKQAAGLIKSDKRKRK